MVVYICLGTTDEYPLFVFIEGMHAGQEGPKGPFGLRVRRCEREFKWATWAFPWGPRHRRERGAYKKLPHEKDESRLSHRPFDSWSHRSPTSHILIEVEQSGLGTYTTQHNTNNWTQQQQSSNMSECKWMKCRICRWAIYFANSRSALGLFVLVYPLYSFPLLFILGRSKMIWSFLLLFLLRWSWMNSPSSFFPRWVRSEVFLLQGRRICSSRHCTLHLSKPNSILFFSTCSRCVGRTFVMDVLDRKASWSHFSFYFPPLRRIQCSVSHTQLIFFPTVSQRVIIFPSHHR